MPWLVSIIDPVVMTVVVIMNLLPAAEPKRMVYLSIKPYATTHEEITLFDADKHSCLSQRTLHPFLSLVAPLPNTPDAGSKQTSSTKPALAALSELHRTYDAKSWQI